MKIDVVLFEEVPPEAYLFECIFELAMASELEDYAQLLTYLLVNDCEMPTTTEMEIRVLQIREKHLRWRQETIREMREIIYAKENATT